MTPYAGQNVVALVQRAPGRREQPDDTWMYLDDVTLTQPAVPGCADRGDRDRGQRLGDGELDGAVDNGGSAITSYTVTPFIGSTAQTPVTVTGSPPATSTTVTGLTNGTAYTFTVSATNAIGTGRPRRRPTRSRRLHRPPGAPTGVTRDRGQRARRR